MSASSVVVRGAGVFGVTAALALRARGLSVTVVDPGPLPRPEAASTDISKIVRMEYGGDGFYTRLMEEALPIWRAWNARFGEELFHEEGFLLISRDGFSPGSFEQASLETLGRRGHRVERLDREDLRRRFPAWGESGYAHGAFNAAGGWVESGKVMGRLIAEARAAGVAFRDGREIDAAECSGTVLAAGAWTPGLCPHLSEVMWPVAQPVFHLRPEDPSAWRAPRFPVWAADIARTGWYGFPANRDGIVKIANHGPGRRVDPEAPRVVEPEDEAALRAFLRASLPGLAEAELVASKTCLYCDSFDGDFWIARDTRHPDTVVAAGASGHGFKFAPVIGEVIADVVLGRPNRNAARFAARASGRRKTEDARFGAS